LFAAMISVREMTAALPQVRPLVSGTGARVHLVLVRPLPRTPERRGEQGAYIDELVEEEYATWQDYLHHHGSVLAYDGIVASREVRFGGLLPEILAVTRRHGSHMIALAAPPRSCRQYLGRPTLAQQLMEQAGVPVLAVPPGRSPARGAHLRYSRVAA
jgi:hypothetical protein